MEWILYFDMSAGYEGRDGSVVCDAPATQWSGQRVSGSRFDDKVLTPSALNLLPKQSGEGN